MTDDEDDDENDDEINSKDRVKGDSDYEPDELKFDEILKDLDFFQDVHYEIKNTKVEFLSVKRRDRIRKRLKSFLWAIVFPHFLKRKKKKQIKEF